MANETTPCTLLKIYYVDPHTKEDYSITVIIIYGCVLSNILLIIHFYKFLKCYSGQKIATKNLTCYCICMFITNIHRLLGFTKLAKLSPTVFIFFHVFLRISASTFSLIMSFDTCMCFRNTAVYLRPIYYSFSKKSATKFKRNCCFGLGVPTLITIIIFLVYNLKRQCEKAMAFVWHSFIVTNIVSQILSMSLVVVSLIYIRMASIDKKKLCTQFPLLARLLLMSGFMPAIPYAILSILSLCFSSSNNDSSRIIFCQCLKLFLSYEGILIALYFTFKKDLFKNVRSRSQSFSASMIDISVINVDPKVIK